MSLDTLRQTIASWMSDNLTGRFAPLKHRGGPGDGDCLPALRKEWEQHLARAGWSCPGWPIAHGGKGLSIAEQIVFQEEYAKAGGPGRLNHIGEGLLGPTLMEFGTEEQKKRFLPPILQATEFWAQGYSEPSAGSDLANIKTRARFDADAQEWVVSGQKVWTSLAHVSDWIFVLARAEEGSVGRHGLVFLLMPLEQAGVEIHPIRQINGGQEFNAVFFDGATAKDEHRIGGIGDGWRIAMALLGFERGLSTLGQQMAFADELDLIVSIAKDNGKAADPVIRQRLGAAFVGLKGMKAFAQRVLSQSDDADTRRDALSYKYHWSNWHRDLSDLALDVMGLEAQTSADPRFERLRQMALFARADTIYGGSNEIQLNIIAETGLFMPKEPRGKP